MPVTVNCIEYFWCWIVFELVYYKSVIENKSLLVYFLQNRLDLRSTSQIMHPLEFPTAMQSFAKIRQAVPLAIRESPTGNLAYKPFYSCLQSMASFFPG